MTVESTLTSVIQAAVGSTIPVRPSVAALTDLPPYVIYTQPTGTRVNSFTGDSGLANPTFQIDVYAKTKGEVIALKKTIRDALLASTVLGAVFLNDGSGYEGDTKLHRHRQDFSLWFYD